MANFGKPNAAGRSSGKLNGRFQKRLGPPPDQPFIWLPRDLINSTAWRLKSRNCARLIDALLAEHLAHAGQENGRLSLTYDQLEKDWKIRRPSIRAAIEEAQRLGLVRKTKQGGRYGEVRKSSQYRLTFYPVIEDYNSISPATNDWKKIQE